ncbi:MAG: NAD(P)/FAD-dependent oxidoreductase [Armatimonadota bacterium]
MDEVYDVVIIGGGPGGNTAALYTARAGLKTLVLAKPGASGSLSLSEHIANFPGVPGPVHGTEVVNIIRRQAEYCGAEYRHEVVVTAELSSDPKMVYTNEGGVYPTQALIIATGAQERQTKVPGEEEFLGRGVSTCTTCDAPFYQGKTAIVTGNDDYAAEECLVLARYATKIHFMLPTTKPAISPGSLAELGQNPVIEMRHGWRLREVIGGENVHGGRFNTAEGEVTVDADGIFIYLGGARPCTSFLQGQLPLDETGAILVDRNYATGIPKVYAVGDVIAGHIRQAVVAAGEGCIAALMVEKELHQRQKVTPDYK